METLELPPKTRTIPTRPLPAGMPASKRKLWLIGAGGIVLVLIGVALLPPKIPVTRLSTVTVRDEAAGTGFVRAKVTIGVGAKINGVVGKRTCIMRRPCRVRHKIK
jgi:hypothetical protein